MRGARPHEIALAIALATTLAALGLGGCSPKQVLRPNLPPATRLFVNFDAGNSDPHTIYHIAHLYWFGSDPDGNVVGYDIRFIPAGGPANTPWTRTTRTDSLFVVPDTLGLVNPTFEVRAVDNQGAVDPAPPRQEFSFSNQAPVVTLLDPPFVGETTFPTQTLDWRGVDPDGDAYQLTYRVWLDGNEASPHVITTTEFTFPSSDFLQRGRYLPGPRTAYVRAVDAGGRLSNTASATWQVRSPAPDTLQRPRLLLVDNVPASDPTNTPFDNFFNQAVTRSGIPAGSFSVLRLETGRPFRSSKDLEQTFKLFDAVVWYRGFIRPTSSAPETLLARHSDGLVAYLESGGQCYLESLDPVTAGDEPGLFTESFMRLHLGSRALFRYKIDEASSSPDSSIIWSIARQYRDTVGVTPVTHLAILHSTLFADSLRIGNPPPAGLRAFVVQDTNDVVLWARDSTLVRRQPFSAPVAVKHATLNGGRFILSSMPVLSGNGVAGASDRFIDKVIQYLGVRP